MQNRIKEIRQNKGISVEQLSRKSGVDTTILDCIEKNELQSISVGNILGICSALTCNIEDIFF